MSEIDAIPADIMATARALVYDDDSAVVALIALALLAEREQCAKICEAYKLPLPFGGGCDEWAVIRVHNTSCDLCAAAIRKQQEPT